MDTNIRFLDVLNLICEDETNPEFGSDDIFTEVDGRRHHVALSRLAARSNSTATSRATRRPGRRLSESRRSPSSTTSAFAVLEEDDVSPNDPSRLQMIPALGPQDMFVDGRANPLQWNFEDGEYRFSFMLQEAGEQAGELTRHWLRLA